MRGLSIVLVLIGLCFGSVAHATEADIYCASSTSSTGAIIWTPCGPAGGGTISTVPDASISTGYQQLTSLGSATGFTPPANTTFCIVEAEGAALRYRTDGQNPTSSVGMPLAIGAYVTFRMSTTNLSAIKFIQQTSSGIADIDCYKDG